MNTKTQKILIAVAAILILAAVAAVVILAVGSFSGKDGEKEDKTADTVHPAEETFYNSDGSVNRVVFYDNDVYNGQTDYYSDGNKDYIIYYDKDKNNCANELIEKNEQGKTVLHKKSENKKTVLLEEYVYADDMVTLKKYTKKEYDENGTENAEKLYYADDGVTVVQRITYVDGEEKTNETFDGENPYSANSEVKN